MTTGCPAVIDIWLDLSFGFLIGSGGELSPFGCAKAESALRLRGELPVGCWWGASCPSVVGFAVGVTVGCPAVIFGWSCRDDVRFGFLVDSRRWSCAFFSLPGPASVAVSFGPGSGEGVVVR